LVVIQYIQYIQYSNVLRGLEQRGNREDVLGVKYCTGEPEA
jgi:hypothetical protein